MFDNMVYSALIYHTICLAMTIYSCILYAHVIVIPHLP